MNAIDPLASPIRLRLDEGVHGWVARSREPGVLSRKLHRTQFCFAVLPLVTQGDFLGLLSFEGTNGTEQPDILREKVTAFSLALGEELHDALRELRPRWLQRTVDAPEMGVARRRGTPLPPNAEACLSMAYVGEEGVRGDDLRRLLAIKILEIRSGPSHG